MAREERKPRHLSDEELEYYGQLYVEQHLREVVEFETFLRDPDRYLRRKPRTLPLPNDGQPPRRSLLGFLRARPLVRSPHS